METVRAVLGTFVRKPSNLERLEEFIEARSEQEGQEIYEVLYEVAGRFLQTEPLTDLGWDHPVFADFVEEQKMQDEFQSRPLEIEEGVLQCYRCGSKKTISFQKQTRSADEGSTTFAQCVQCGKRWRHNN